MSKSTKSYSKSYPKSRAPGTSGTPAVPAAKKAAKPVIAAENVATKPAPTSALDGAAPPAAKQADASLVDAPKSVIMGPVMRKKQLIDAVVERSGTKKKDAKPVVEAVMAVLAEALVDNRELVLPPLGRFKIRKERKLANSRVLTIKLRQSAASEAVKTPAESDAD